MPWYLLVPTACTVGNKARTIKENEFNVACLATFNGFWCKRDGFQDQMECNIEILPAKNNPSEDA